ncbi:MAG: hypothetical protein EOP50_17310, partial [Sphingobacteriales bacterium]
MIDENNYWRDVIPYTGKDRQGWYDVSVAPMGKGCVVTYFNVTHLRAQQEQIRQQALEFESILHAAETRILVLTPEFHADGTFADARIRIANQAYARFKETTVEQLIGEKASAVFPKPHVPAIFSHYADTLATGKSTRFDLHCDDPGRVFWVDIVVSRLDTELLVTINDYTRQRLLQLELEQKIRELERSNHNLEEFAYAASHDLKEPIRKVRFFIDRLQDRLKPEPASDVAHDFERLHVSTERMRDLVDDLLSYAQVSLRPQQLEEVSLSDVLRNVQFDLELEIEQLGARLEITELPAVQGHQRQLQQLFQNLLANALKYHRSGTPPHIRVSARKTFGYDTAAQLGPKDAERAYWLVEVADNGIGFEQSEAERIFQVFQRLHGNSEYRGTGVG